MDSSLHSNIDNNLSVPEELEHDTSVDNWYTQEGVYGANAYYCKSKKEGEPTQVKIAKRFFEQVKDGYHESEFGPPPKVRKIAKDIEMTEQRVARLSNYLALDDEDRPVAGSPPDLGDERLNGLVSFLNYHFNIINGKFDVIDGRFDAIDGRFDAIDGRFDAVDGRFDAIDQKFDLMDRRISSVTARFENKFKQKGGPVNTPYAYSPIINGSYEYPHENGLNKITSVDQIDRFRTSEIDRYLEFYGLNTDGNLQKNKIRLAAYLGINIYET